jgi:hypothetical protein
MERLKREGVKRFIIVKSPTQEKCRFTVPPAGALLNCTYKQWNTLADFWPNYDISRGFLYISLTKTKKLKKKLYSKVIKLRTVGCKST